MIRLMPFTRTGTLKLIRSPRGFVGETQVREKLCAVNRQDDLCGFHLHKNLGANQQIQSIGAFDLHTLVES